MDHMPWPKGASPDLIEVPLVEYIPYDFLGYDNFPRRNGFDIYDGHTRTIEPARLASIIQSWLYFGLLSEVTGETIPLEHFTKVSNRQGASR